KPGRPRWAGLARLGLGNPRSRHSNDEGCNMNRITSCLLAILLAVGIASNASAAPKKEFDIAWTIYVGWMPWPYAAETGIVKKWADKYGIKINTTQTNKHC